MATHPSPQSTRRTPVVLAGLVAFLMLVAVACSGDLVHTFKTFRSAVDRGASCSELFDQRARFHNPETLARIDTELARIGCTSRTATRGAPAAAIPDTPVGDALG
jgi:hypothetical protein